MRKTLWVVGVLALAVAVMSAGCGNARKVESCDECIQGATYLETEFCVWGQGYSGHYSLYCANGCRSDADCMADYWCMPMVDQGTPYSHEYMQWVCMPRSYYNEGRTYYVSSCVGDPCPTSMTCIDSSTGEHFCSDSCIADSDCVSGCCYSDGMGGKWCVPWTGYCD